MSPTEIEIKKALLDAQIKQIDVARKLRISRQFVNKVIKGQRPTRRVRRAIAKAVGKRVEELWPSGPFEKAA
jgi:transcriptional regulator with XRE-family HTH domain